MILSCNRDTEKEVIIEDNPGDDIIVDESGEELSPEDAQALAEETSKQSRATYLEAYVNGNSETCDGIVSEDLRYSCVQSALTQRAIKEGNVELCKELETKKGQESCKEAFARDYMPETSEEVSE